MYINIQESLNKLYLLGFSHIAAKCGMIAAKKKLYEVLNSHPKSISEIAIYLGFSLAGTKKFLRVLDAFELVEIVASDKVKASSLTPHLDYLLGTHLLHGYKAIDELEYSLKGDIACWEKAYQKNFYDYVKSESNEARIFSTWCKQTADWWLKGVTDLYNFSPYKTIVDLGGGSGELLLTILKNLPDAQGVLFEIPMVIQAAKENIASNMIGKRITCIEGDFFDSIPAGGDLYILSRALLNWSDDKSLDIINRCYNVMEKESKLIILDFVLPEKQTPYYHQAVLSDINLYAVLHSSNRMKQEWQTLISRSHFKQCHYLETSEEQTTKNNLIMPICLLEMSKNT